MSCELDKLSLAEKLKMKYIQRSLNKKMKLSIKDFFSKCPNPQFPAFRSSLKNLIH